MSLAEMDAGFGREAEEGGPGRRVMGFPRPARGRVAGWLMKANGGGPDGDAG